MSLLDLALEAKNTLVSEFSSLVDNASAAVDTVSNTISNVGSVASIPSQFTTKQTVSTMSKLNTYASNAKSKVNSFTNGARSVTNAINNTSSSLSGTVSNTQQSTNNVNTHKSNVSESSNETKLDKQLYDKSLNLPEAKSVSLYYSSEANRQYGTFTGGTVYKDFNGTIDDTAKNVQPISGWLTLNTKSDKYAWVTNGNTSYIIGINNFKPEPIAEDLQPIYDKLKDNKCINDELVVNDTILAQSQAATFKEYSSEAINNNSEDTEKFMSGTLIPESGVPSSWVPKSLPSKNSNKEASDKVKNTNKLSVVYPKQVAITKKEGTFNDSQYNSVQAVVYDIAAKEFSPDLIKDTNNGFSTAGSVLLCYQQPENISYTSSAQYDSPAPRGSQQPFQFYITNNAMNLNFTLKWHIDEIRTLLKASGGAAYTIQDIAQIAEDFTRPWKSGDSISPKLCKVILPGIQHIGYITEAQISYSGDMSGDYQTGGGVLSGFNDPRKVTNYFYSQIDVTFNMIIIKDIELKPATAAKQHMYIDGITYSNESSDASQDNKPDQNKEVKDNSGDQAGDPISAVSASSNSNNNVTGEVSSAEGFDFSDTDVIDLEDPVYNFDIDENENIIMYDQFGNAYMSTGDGFYADENGNEMFMANGYPKRIVGEDSDGDKYYLGDDIDPETGEPVHIKAKYESGGTDHIDEGDELLIQIGA